MRSGVNLTRLESTTGRRIITVRRHSCFMKIHTHVMMSAALLGSLIVGCSKHPQVADLGIVNVSAGTAYHDLGDSRACVITPTMLESNMVRLAITIQATNSAGLVGRVATTRADVSVGKPWQISIGDNFDIRLTPQVDP
jgi:hypothetical protein